METYDEDIQHFFSAIKNFHTKSEEGDGLIAREAQRLRLNASPPAKVRKYQLTKRFCTIYNNQPIFKSRIGRWHISRSFPSNRELASWDCTAWTLKCLDTRLINMIDWIEEISPGKSRSFIKGVNISFLSGHRSAYSRTPFCSIYYRRKAPF